MGAAAPIGMSTANFALDQVSGRKRRKAARRASELQQRQALQNAKVQREAIEVDRQRAVKKRHNLLSTQLGSQKARFGASGVSVKGSTSAKSVLKGFKESATADVADINADARDQINTINRELGFAAQRDLLAQRATRDQEKLGNIQSVLDGLNQIGGEIIKR